LLPLAETSNDLPKLAAEYAEDFAEVARVRDGVSLGFRSLALGRWYVGVGGLALARQTGDAQQVAAQALEHLKEAIRHFSNQGMDPWVLYAELQVAKALADLRRWDESQECIKRVSDDLVRFPILGSHLYETVGQLQAMWRSPLAEQSFEQAVRYAEESGLLARRETLSQNLQRYQQSLSSAAEP
jgi:tetratricopeptide (TPR) repeat protein